MPEQVLALGQCLLITQEGVVGCKHIMALQWEDTDGKRGGGGWYGGGEGVVDRATEAAESGWEAQSRQFR